MYDELARTQNPTPLEWFVVHAVIPSVLVTAALHWQPAVGAAAPTPPIVTEEFVIVCGYSPPLIPDLVPTLVRMPRPTYPESMRRSGIDGRVVLKALINTRRGVPSSAVGTRASRGLDHDRR